ncbi:MAG: hypothetical protein ACYDA4_06615 [Ignavibacteriaceae bacterium]
MKTFILFTFLIIQFCFLNFTYAQKDNFGAFGAPELKFTRIVDQNALIVGGRFGWVIDSQFVLGGGIYALASIVNLNLYDPVSGEKLQLGFNCGGLEFEYIFFSEEKVHASVDMLCAGAGVTYSVPDKSKPHSSYFSQNLLVWEPQLNLEINVVKWLHIDAGASYRLVSSFQSYYGLMDKNLEGLTGVITFKIGSY